MGIRVIDVESDEGWEGAVKSSLNGATIYFDPTVHQHRQRFTMAHELGHLMLHPTGIMFRDDDFRGTLREREANEFAANFLMPTWILHSYAMDGRWSKIDLAKMFLVSPQAMEIQLRTMGL
jgi:Zn-dependent peptidase ImmA (M78 family)